MVTEQVEREDKYDVGPEFSVPDLQSVRPDGVRVEQATVELVSTYYDTVGQDLRLNRLTLRRRRGDTDSGWQMKVPAGPGRVEVRVDDAPSPSGSAPADAVPTDAVPTDAVPTELSALLTGVRRGQDLVAVARVTTRRSVHRLFDADDGLLAEIADDRVHATSLGPPEHTAGTGTARTGTPGSVTASRWREVEVEVGPEGDEALLAAVGHLLVAAGAVASEHASKLDRTLGAPVAPPSIGTDSVLADLVAAYLRTQCAAIVAGDLGLRRGQDVVHPTRVAIRRLRSTLRTFALLFHPESAAVLETELVWFAGLLGTLRDADVLRVRLTRLVEGLPVDQVLGPVAARIDSDLGARRRDGEAELLAALDSQRLLALHGLIQTWRLAPPFSARADAPAGGVSRYLRRARKKLRTRVDAAAAPDAGNELVHRARKAGKRFRYAAELAEPTLGSAARDQVEQGERLQDLLGEHQDSVVSAETLRRLGAIAGTTPGENGFTFGVLFAHEQHRAADVRARLAAKDY